MKDPCTEWIHFKGYKVHESGPCGSCKTHNSLQQTILKLHEFLKFKQKNHKSCMFAKIKKTF